MRNFHLPLPDDTYDRLRAAATAARVPSASKRLRLYAAEMAGTKLDVDPDLEAAAVEHLRKTGRTGK